MIFNPILFIGFMTVLFMLALSLDRRGFLPKRRSMDFDDFYFQTEIRNRYLKRHMPKILDFNFKISLDKSYVVRDDDGSLRRVFKDDK